MDNLNVVTPYSPLGKARAALARWESLTTDDYVSDSESMARTISDLGDALTALASAVTTALDADLAHLESTSMWGLRNVFERERYVEEASFHYGFGGGIGTVRGIVAVLPVRS